MFILLLPSVSKIFYQNDLLCIRFPYFNAAFFTPELYAFLNLLNIHMICFTSFQNFIKFLCKIPIRRKHAKNWINLTFLYPCSIAFLNLHKICYQMMGYTAFFIFFHFDQNYDLRGQPGVQIRYFPQGLLRGIGSLFF